MKQAGKDQRRSAALCTHRNTEHWLDLQTAYYHRSMIFIIGTFCTGEETKGKTEIREVIADPASVKEAEAALRIFAEERGGCRVFGCNWELFLEEETAEPLLMGKVPGGGLPEAWKNSRVFIHEVV